MKKTAAIIGTAVLLALFLWVLSVIYIDWLWFKQLGFANSYLIFLTSDWIVKFAGWLIFALFLYLNLRRTEKTILEMPNLILRHVLMNTRFGNILTPKRLRAFFLLLTVLISSIISAISGSEWITIRLLKAASPTGVSDPVFGRDLSFYFFSLPFLELLYQYLLVLFIVTAVVCTAFYLLVSPPQQIGVRRFLPQTGTSHLSLLLAGTLMVVALGYRLQMYNLLYSQRGVFFGAGFTDLRVLLPAYWLLLIISVLIVLALLLNFKVKSTRFITGGLTAVIALSVLVNFLLPPAVQKFIVEPNEFVQEEPYLRHNLDFTQKAYGLDQLQLRQFPLTGPLSYEELTATEGTIENIRLWDWRPLLLTYNQLQALRDYYTFHDVDTDRYSINGKQVQLMLSAREMQAVKLSSPTWVNMRLFYTHGYGVVANKVNAVSKQRLPEFLLRDFPIQGGSALQVEVPQIYYGELTDYYIFTGTRTDEFDYPLGETNATTRYEGEGGLPVGGFFRRLLLALRFSDYRILFSNELTATSRIHFNREIISRVQKIMPFLKYDNDPYLVIDGGRLYWLLDAYTVSNRYPYAEPYEGINYIRNSVKVTVDAYNGTVRFYVFQPDEPYIAAYMKIFPDLFISAEKIPAGLKEHVRYPEFLFTIQSHIFATYHMGDAKVFYNKEDRWQIPLEKYGEETVPLQPYYTILNLPGEEDPEFVLILPYTMYNRNNMVAWLAGRCDGKHYGQLVCYQFPKGELLYGPAQIEARIDQDTAISQQLALWNQQGSRVVRGNLLVLPINGTILYVEPLYLQAEQSQFPELARVIVAYGDKIVMENTLAESLAAVFGLHPAEEKEPVDTEPPGTDPGENNLQQLIKEAADLYDAAQEALRRGDWSEYGRLQEELGKVISALQKVERQQETENQAEIGEE